MKQRRVTPESRSDAQADPVRMGRRTRLIRASAVASALVLGALGSCRALRPSPGSAPADEPPSPARPQEPATPGPEAPPIEPLPETFKDGCPACGMGYTALPSKTFLSHYTELDPERASR